MPLRSMLVILRFCIRFGDIWVRSFILNVLALFGKHATFQGSGSVFLGSYELCAVLLLSLSVWLWKYDYLGQSAERSLAVKGFLASCSLKKIWYAPHSVKNKSDGIAHWEKVPYLKIVYQLNKRIILKHFALLRAEVSEIVFPILLT